MLAVTGIGMVSSLGLDVVSSCAAARAGISRIVETDDLRVPNLEGDLAAPIAVHRAPRISAGLFGFARLLQLGAAALDDLAQWDINLSGARLGMILISNSGVYEEAWSRRLREKPNEAAELDYESYSTEIRAKVARDLLPALVRAAGLDIVPALQATLTSTAIGFVAALRQAKIWLDRGACERCIVGGVDSLVVPASLMALDGLGLLRTPDRSVGILPGEGACFIVVERAHDASPRGPSVCAILDAPAEARESPNPLLEENGEGGRGLRAAMAETFNHLPDRGAATGLLIVNLNGDSYRAGSWGLAVTATTLLPGLGTLPMWIPPLFFGETGTAAGPMSVALFARGVARRYAPANALICLMDDGGGRGTVYARAPRETLS
jgi:3-oxoacyl-(acyl-carrier-protein) synthase